MPRMSILIKGARIITQDSQRSIIDGDVYVIGNKIRSIGKDLETDADDVIEARGKIAMPGLVNAHTHLGMTLLRGYGEDLALDPWLRERIWPIEARQTDKQAGIGASLAFCEMIRGGITSFGDMCIHDPRYIFDAAKASGMRGVIARGLMDFDSPDFRPRVLKEIGNSLAYGDDRVRPGVSVHAPYTCSEELIVRSKELARKNGLTFQIHVSETRKEIFDVLKKRGSYPYEYLDLLGILDDRSIFAHGGWLTKKEMDIAGKRKLNVANCPISSLKLATGGIGQIAELDELGANVCLGTDGAASNNSLNMFETMKMSSLLQKHHYWKADRIPTQKILDFATLNGARAFGFDSGSIELGKLADIILLERGPNMYPENDLVSNIVYSAGPQNVTDSIIDGKIVMRERRIISMDEASVLEEASRAAKDLISG